MAVINASFVGWVERSDTQQFKRWVSRCSTHPTKLLDTNAISELMRLKLDAVVVEWQDYNPSTELPTNFIVCRFDKRFSVLKFALGAYGEFCIACSVVAYFRNVAVKLRWGFDVGGLKFQE